MNAELIRKLRLADGMKAVVFHSPADFDVLGELGLPDSCGHDVFGPELTEEGSCDYVLLFVNTLAERERDAPAVISCLKPDGLFWIS